jgi:prephenate dehydrogenase
MALVVSIQGLGLMGGSLGMALRARGGAVRVRAWARRAETRARALECGAADEVFLSPAESASGADIVVLCGPVMNIPEMAEACRPGLAPGAVVTDVGSTKQWIESECRRVLEGSGAGFVGSHPMTGSERTGLESARADLFQGAVTVVTGAGEEAERVAELWRMAGSQVARIGAGEHDALVARISHLPHLAAALVARTAARPGLDSDRLRRVAGPGFRDTTRVAAGSPGIWTDIARTNREALLGELDALGRELAVLRAAVTAGDWNAVNDFLNAARAARGTLWPATRGREEFS